MVCGAALDIAHATQRPHGQIVREMGAEDIRRSCARTPVTNDKKSCADLALDAVCRQYRDDIELTAVDALPAGAYDVDIANCELFVVSNHAELRVGGSSYIAVDRATGAVRHLGRLGE